MDDDHYLKRELYARVREDPRIFEFLQDGSLDGLWYWDLESPANEWMSPRFWRTFGIDPARKRHLSAEWQDLINPDDLELALANFRRHCEDPGHAYDQLVRYRHADGSTVWVRCRGLAIRDADGTPIRMLGAHTDVTKLKLAEEELARRLADTTARELVQTLPLALLIVSGRGAIEFANHASEKLLGYSREELVGQPIELVIPRAHRDEHASYVKAYQRAPSVRRMGLGRDVVALRKDGSEVPVEIGLAPLETSNGVVTIASLIDITARLEHQRRLERSNRDLERFAYVTSHDLQAPLRQVVGFARILQESLRDQLTDEQREDLNFLLAATRRMQRMIQAILTFSRLQRTPPRREPVRLDDVLTSVKAALSEEIERTNATIDAPGLPTLLGDQAHFVMVFQNLIANALKFREERRAPVVRVRAEKRAGVWRLRVSDNGIGFPAKYADEVFQMFRRLENRQRYPGTGIGLAIVRRVVEEHGGRVWAESERGVGTTIFIEWPAPREDARDTTPRSDTARDEGRGEGEHEGA